MRLVRPALASLLAVPCLFVCAAAGAAAPTTPGLERIPAAPAGDVQPPPSLSHHVDPPAEPNVAFDEHATPSAAGAAHPSAHGSTRAGEARAADDDDGPDGPPQPVAWTIEDRRAAHRTHLLTLGIGAWPTALDAQLWYAVPLLRRGFLPRVNDAFHLEFGSLLSWGADGTVALWPAVGVRWDFYLTRRWATFFGLKLAAEVHLNRDQRVHPNAVVGFGGLLRLAERLLLRLELGYPQGLSVGLAVPLGPV